VFWTAYAFRRWLIAIALSGACPEFVAYFKIVDCFLEIGDLVKVDGNAGSIFARQAAEDAGDIAETERLYRVLTNCDPTDAAPPFNLGNMFRATGRKIEAEAALRAATRADPTFAEAWYNLSDLLDEQGRSEAAIDCLRRALQAAPDYADAMFNLALLLQRGSRHKEAAECWRQYLANDAQSEWAARARRSLKFCEMQIHLSAS
jgi:tetratricopeptide (TPR) repeat protein